MKKIFSLFSALLLTVSMWGATTYTAYVNSDVVVTDLSQGTNYCYQLDYTQKAGGQYSSDVCLIIYPEGPSIAGTYRLQDGNISVNSYVLNNGSTRYITDWKGSSPYKYFEISIKDNGNDTYTISGALRTKSGNSYYYYMYDVTDNTSNNPVTLDPVESPSANNTFTPVAPDPYKDEPDASEISFTGASVVDYSTASDVILDFNSSDGWDYLELQFNGVTSLEEGVAYTVTNTGATGTIMASMGMGDYYPVPSYFSYSGGYYFITGGSVTVDISDDGQTLSMTGALTTAHGSTITVNCTGVNPWAPAITVDVVVSSTTATMQRNGYLNIEMTGTPNFAIAGTCTQITDLTATNLNATYTYVNLPTGNSEIDKTKTNTLTIVATGNTEEYKLNASIVCKNGNTYNLTDVIFTCHIPNAWDEEVATDDFTFTASTLLGVDDMIASKGYVVYRFQNTSGEEAHIAIATATKTLEAGVYPAVLSEGNTSSTYTASYQPSVILKGSWADKPYFVRSGNVTLAYSDDKQTLSITGEVTTYRGTKVTLNLSGVNPDAPKEATITVGEMTVTVGPAALTFDAVAATGTTPKSITLIIVGQDQPLFGTYGSEDLDYDYTYVWTSGSHYAYLSGANQEVTIVEKGNGVYTLNAALTCNDGYTYFIKDQDFMYNFTLDATLPFAGQIARIGEARFNANFNQRTLIKDNCVNSICLPFSIANIEETPLAGATVYSMTDAIMDGEVISFIFETVNAIEAGKPYLIKWPAGTSIVNPVFNNVTIEATEGAMVEGANAKFIGILEPTVMDANSLFVGANNTVSYSNDENKVASLKGFRAYFQLSTMATAPKKACLVLGGNSAPTSILTPKAMKYNKVIENGQFVIIRNNVRINALGQTIR